MFKHLDTLKVVEDKETGGGYCIPDLHCGICDKLIACNHKFWNITRKNKPELYANLKEHITKWQYLKDELNAKG